MDGTTRYQFELVGQQPMLMHRDDLKAAKLIDIWIKDPGNKNLSVAGDDRTPAWRWHYYLHHDGVHVATPSEQVMAALRYAGSQMILKRQTTFKSISQSGIIPTKEHFDFFVKGKQIPMSAIRALHDLPFEEQEERACAMGFELNVGRVVVGTSRHVRVRPKFYPGWTVRGEIYCTADDVLTEDVLQMLFDLAGSRAGLGDWRPNSKKPGPYGIFKASLKRL